MTARRPTLTTALALLALTCTGGIAAAAPSTPVVAPTQRLAVLVTSQQALSRPGPGAAPVAFQQAERPLTGEPTTLPVVGRWRDASKRIWLHVRVPGRPNGRTAWIRQSGTRLATTPWHVVVDLSSRRVVVYRGGRVVRSFAAIIGKPSTPTPRGEFFVEETVALRSGDPGAPFALALSARSYVLQEFAGGPGQIALHGLSHVGGVLGTAVSHGCVRLDTAAITWLAMRLGPGVPVTIRT